MVAEFISNNFWLCFSVCGLILVICMWGVWAELKLSYMEYVDEIGKKLC